MATKRQEIKEQETKEVVIKAPDYLQKFMNQSNHDVASLATASISIPRLTYRGKRFRFVKNGEEELVKDFTVKVVVVGVEPDPGKFVKTYYEKQYEPGDTIPPDCSSTDGIRPDTWVSSPQSQYCSNCPKNVFGSATSMSGGKAKACKDGKILWVMKTDDLSEPYGLKIPVMSLKNLSEYGKYIHKNGYPLSLVITEIGLDDEAEFPKLTFKHSGFVEEASSEAIVKINTERPWRAFKEVVLIDNDPRTPPPLPQKTVVDEKAAVKSIEDAVSEW